MGLFIEILVLLQTPNQNIVILLIVNRLTYYFRFVARSIKSQSQKKQLNDITNIYPVNWSD